MPPIKSIRSRILFLCSFTLALGGFGHAAKAAEADGQMLWKAWLESQVGILETQSECFQTRADWENWQAKGREQLLDMLGLHPMPEKSDLKATVTGSLEVGDVTIEKLHYQSLPGLYVTANLYRPTKTNGKKLPAVLYVCGHADKQKDGKRFGNKTGYEHHALWYAKQGFVCLIIDTVQLGEIEGHHHGTYRLGRFWWVSRGYTPAGVEAWAGVRGLDYLQSREEVDPEKLGVAGRSGGGAYTYWIAAIDERVKCAVAVAGITTLRDHVVEGVVSGHCDCMFMVNQQRWDYDLVASLIAPRPLLISNTDKDTIFPLEGVLDIHRKTRRVYRLLGAENHLGLHLAEGGHANVQPLHTGEFHWMSRFLQGKDVMAQLPPADQRIPMESLKVLEKNPEDARNLRIDETFVSAFTAPSLKNAGAWAAWKEKTLSDLKSNTSLRVSPVQLRWLGENKEGWDFEGVLPVQKEGKKQASHAQEMLAGIRHDREEARERGDLRVERYQVVRHQEMPLDLILLRSKAGASQKVRQVRFRVLNSADADLLQQVKSTFKVDGNAEAWNAIERELPSTLQQDEAVIWIMPRGLGETAFQGKESEIIHQKRALYLLGTTLESLQVEEIRLGLLSIKEIPGFETATIAVEASQDQAANAIYAQLLHGKDVALESMTLASLPVSHQESSTYLNVLKYTDLPYSLAMLAEKTPVTLKVTEVDRWKDLLEGMKAEGIEIKAEVLPLAGP